MWITLPKPRSTAGNTIPEKSLKSFGLPHLNASIRDLAADKLVSGAQSEYVHV